MNQESASQALLQPYALGPITLPNRVVMSALTRARAENPELVPTPLMAEYYAQRASAGLIITESAWMSRQAVGFVNIPGIFTAEQIAGWQSVTRAVHEKGGRIFLQIVHSGSVSHPSLHEGELPVAPSAINPQEKAYTPNGFEDTVTPRELSVADIEALVQDYRQAARNAQAAGFDGVELHAQLHFLLPQFLSELLNQRQDQYGGSLENRARFLFEVITALIEVWGPGRVGVKFTPAASSAGVYKTTEQTLPTFEYVVRRLNDYPLAYLQLVQPIPLATGTAIETLPDLIAHFRPLYHGTLVAVGGFTQQSANALLARGGADLVAFGQAYVANPDLVERFAQHYPLATGDRDTYYQGGAKGYADYPFMPVKPSPDLSPTTPAAVVD